MQIQIRGTQHEVYAMADWLPLLFCVVGSVHISRDHDLYRLDADVHPLGQRAS
jgi:hypothetical protein